MTPEPAGRGGAGPRGGGGGGRRGAGGRRRPGARPRGGLEEARGGVRSAAGAVEHDHESSGALVEAGWNVQGGRTIRGADRGQPGPGAEPIGARGAEREPTECGTAP